jgi:hypothetical protein
MKRCSTCKKVKVFSEFHKNSLREDGYSLTCKSCKKEFAKSWYSRRSESQKQIVLVRKERVQRENRERIEEHLRNHPCVDCGEKDIIVLEFDHVRGIKKKEVSIMRYTYCWETVQKEIEKCEVRCANCHRRATHFRKINFNKSKG